VYVLSDGGQNAPQYQKCENSAKVCQGKSDVIYVALYL